MSALLARKGFTANPDAFEHKQGFLKLFSDGGQYDVARVLDGWGAMLDIENPGASYKVYPCCYSTHSAIQGALALVREHGLFATDEIDRVETRTSERALKHTDRPYPKTPLEAKFSVQYCVLRALTEGKVILEHFEGAAHAEPRIEGLLKRTRSSAYEGPFFNDDDRFDAIVGVTLKNGRKLETKVDAPLGRTAADPVPTTALDEKFRDCAGRVLSKDAAEAVCRRIWSMDQVASVREMTAMLETAPDPGLRIRVADAGVHA